MPNSFFNHQVDSKVSKIILPKALPSTITLPKLLANLFLKAITQVGHGVIIHLIHVHPFVDHSLAELYYMYQVS
jgi:hypothetical protein